MCFLTGIVKHSQKDKEWDNCERGFEAFSEYINVLLINMKINVNGILARA